MKKLLLLFFLAISTMSFSQTIFSEPFDEAAGSTSGVDNVGGVSWSTNAPYSVASTDYFKVVGGMLEGRDSNGPAVFETGVIDVSSCYNDLLVSLDLSQIGTMESAGGCNSVDIIKLEYSFDNGSTWTAVGNAIEGTVLVDTIIYNSSSCGVGDVVGPFITLGGFSDFTFTECIPKLSNSFKLKITVMEWAGAEYHRVDNVSVSCSSCFIALPIELIDFDGYSDGRVNRLYWTTASEINNDYFLLERSENGIHWKTLAEVKGVGNSSVKTNYEFIDEYPYVMTTYYRLSQVDFDGKEEMFHTIAVENESGVFYIYSKSSDNNLYLSSPYYFEFYNMMGQKVVYGTGNVVETEGLSQGIYVLKIEGGYTHKFFVR